jgi:signal transduction histidine kinase
MLTDPTPYRTADITTDPRFRGWWPATHPLMRSFLGLPIVFKGDVIGAFYLTDKTTGPEFTEDDERLVGVLAPHAAVLIEHARLYEQSRELSVLDERNRLARELHDAMTQALFGLRLTIETAASLAPDDPHAAATELERARGLVDSLFGELRSLIFELRPPALEAEGLGATVRKHLEVVGRANDLAVDVSVKDASDLLPEVEHELFRILQEATTNAVRHAHASSLKVGLDAGTDRVILTVVDDGDGFDPSARVIRSRRLGLTSMRERAQAVGGKLTVESAPGVGTTVRVEVPRGDR